MGINRWLNIIIDGNSALGPYWSEIFSEYLEKIIRSFYDNSREQGANCELGLVVYNANSDIGLKLQYVNWTRDVHYLLGTLSCLAFNGDNLDQHTMVEGLAEALMMFPRPSDKMTLQEYYNGERHCILVASEDPVAKRILVTLPTLEEGLVVGEGLTPLHADFLEVAQMFAPLAVTLSILTPKQHPIFGAIFNLGNDYSPMVNTLISNHRIDQLTVLLSRNFKEAREVLHKKKMMDLASKRNVESTKTTNIQRPTFFASGCRDLSSVVNKTNGDQINEGAQDVRLESAKPLALVTPNATKDQTHVDLFPSSSQSKNVYDDITAALSNDDFLPRKKSKPGLTMLEDDPLKDPFEPDKLTPSDASLGQEQIMPNKEKISLEVLRAVEESRHVLNDIPMQSVSKNLTPIIDLTSNSPEVINNPISPGVVSKAPTSTTTGERSSKGPVQEGPKTLTYPMSLNNITAKLGIVETQDPPPVGASSGNSMFPHAAGDSLTQFQSYSSPTLQPVLPYGSISDQQIRRHHQYPNQMNAFCPLGTPANETTPLVSIVPTMPKFNPHHFWPPPSSFTGFQDYVHAWEGSLVGKIHAKRTSIHKAKALRRPTSPPVLTIEWSARLEIALFVPKKAVNHTMMNYPGPVDYVFFHIVQFNNLDLYDYMMGRNMCAKIILPSQTLVLSTTESKHHYIGTVFPGDIIFVEPV